MIKGLFLRQNDFRRIYALKLFSDYFCAKIILALFLHQKKILGLFLRQKHFRKTCALKCFEYNFLAEII